MSGGITTTPPGTGMIPAAVPFVAEDLTPTPLSFRFLFELFKNSGNYAQRLAALEAKMGVTDGSNAAAGQIGEYLVTTAEGVGLSSATYTDIATLTLTAGDWDVAGSAIISPSTNSLTQAEAWLSTVANTPQNQGVFFISGATAGVGIFSTIAAPVGPVRFSITAPATQVAHLGCAATFPSGTTVTVSAYISARRIR